MGKVTLLSALAFAAFCNGESYTWDLPKGFPKPHVPADNPMSAAKVELGRYLFYDARMSVNGRFSCATCHRQELAFTDGRQVAIGTTGEQHSRGSMSLVNVVYDAALTWSNPRLKELEEQAVVPMFGEHPVELGMREGHGVPGSIRSDSKYRSLFERAFPEDAERFTFSNAAKAIASFERSIISARSPWDRYHYGGEDAAVSDAVKRGEILFFSQQLSCFRCHGGFNFSGATVSEGRDAREPEFHNTGLYNEYPSPNLGIFAFTGNPKDLGKFKAPTLRNIALTAPYMHDGSIPTLAGVVDRYAAGGKNHPNKDRLINGFAMSGQDRDDLIEFLKSLSDVAVTKDPRFSNPW